MISKGNKVHYVTLFIIIIIITTALLYMHFCVKYIEHQVIRIRIIVHF